MRGFWWPIKVVATGWWYSQFWANGLSLALQIIVGGLFFGYLFMFGSIAMVLRGWKPGWFVKHIDEQIIAGTPYRREESIGVWGTMVIACLLLAGVSSWGHLKIAPEKPDLAKTILDGVKSIVEKQPKPVTQIISPISVPPTVPVPPPATRPPTATLLFDLIPGEYNPNPFIEGQSLPCNFSVTNLGPTDADRVVMRVGCGVHIVAHSKSSEDSLFQELMSRSTVFKLRGIPVNETTRRLLATAPLTSDDVDGIDKYRSIVYYAAVLDYEDMNGSHEAEVCGAYVLPFSKGPGPSLHMGGKCSTHNSIR